ncbi:MFS transporter [Thermus sp. FJN-A]
MREDVSLAWRFVVAMGLVSLLADLTYEGGRSVSGAFLGALGASSLWVGAVSGLGEFFGYAVRLLSGRLGERHLAWPLLYLGYALNLLALPALALAGSPYGASLLLFLERLGKGLRTPVRDALLARAGAEVGMGRAFGLHELMDQVGAVLGPLVVALAVAQGGYRLGFAVLAVPALLALGLLTRARGLEPEAARGAGKTPLPRAFPLYLLFAGLFALGFVHFQILAFHLERAGAPPAGIALLFALAMGADALLAFLGGLAFDRLRFRVLLLVPFLAGWGSSLVLLGTSPLPWALGAALWGGALGLQESVVRAGVGHLSQGSAWAYGLFDGVFGTAWLLGSLLMGYLYTLSPAHAAWGTLAAEALALASLAFLLRKGVA